MEKMGLANTPAQEAVGTADRKRELHTEFGELRRDWFKKKGISLEGKTYSEVREAIQQFYSENGEIIKETLEKKSEDVEGDIEVIAKRELTLKQIADVRKCLGLEKWVSLAETVAFVKTAMDLSDEEITQKYADYCAHGISLDDMRNVLAYDNDVKPVRLDTDIYHQSPERSRSAVEIFSNAADAVSQTGYTIGRFGVGFYQILSHLKTEDDIVSVETGNDKEGYYRIEFQLKDKEIKFHLEEIEEKRSPGTTVKLTQKRFFEGRSDCAAEETLCI